MMKKIRLQQRRKESPTVKLRPDEVESFQDFWQNMYSEERPPELRKTEEPPSKPPTAKEVHK